MNAEVAGVEVATDVVLATGEVTAGQSSGDGITRLADIARRCPYTDVRTETGEVAAGRSYGGVIAHVANVRRLGQSKVETRKNEELGMSTAE